MPWRGVAARTGRGWGIVQETVEPRAIGAAKAARLLGINRSTVYTLIHSGRLDAVEISERRYIIPIAGIDRLLADVKRPKAGRR